MAPIAAAIVALLAAGCPKAFPEDDVATTPNDGGGGSAGTSGGGGEAGDASVDVDGAGGAAGDAAAEDGPTADAEDAGDGGGAVGTIGASCSPPLALACAGHAQKLTLYCDPTIAKWTVSGACSGQQLCDTRPGATQGSCQDPVPLCIGHAPGDALCDGTTSVVCGLDLVTSTETACQYVCTSGACGGSCSPGSRQCNGATPQACDAAGAWQDEASCPYVCTGEGQCTGACVQGTKQCSGQVPQSCDSSGKWVDGTACTGVCSAGACAGSCTSGTTQCSGKTVQTCVAGAWQDGVTCAHVCSGGACTGECDPGATQCSGIVPQTCDANGAWQSGTACSYVCASGACTGSCSPSAKQCSGLTPQVCDSDAQWQSGAPCAFVCAAGVCIGTCSPGAKQCNGQVPQTCDATGQWQSGAACANVCTAGQCTGACTPGSKQCNGQVPQTCDGSGAWQNGTACAYVCSGGACTGSCVPGSKQCAGTGSLTPQTCDASGAWQGSAACNATNGMASCSGGTCAIACNPGYGDCDGSAGNGCEVTLTNTAPHCGTCATACSGSTPSCSAGTCVSQCADFKKDGAETDVDCGGGTCAKCATGKVCSAASDCTSGYCTPGTPHVCAAAPVATSCQTSGPGLTNCGDGGSGTESCCTSLPVTGGTFYRSYDGISSGYMSTSYPATISSFRLDKYEITVGRFRQFVAAWDGGWRPAQGAGKHTHLNGGSGLANTAGGYETGWDATNWNGLLATTNATWSDTSHLSCNSTYRTWTSSGGSNENRPINCETWYEAEAFCIWDEGFLPSEAEWNYAAAGGSEQRAYPWSSAYPPGATTIDCSYANYYGAAGPTYCSGTYTNNVGTENPKGKGKWGQADLAGNISEWNLDWYPSPNGPYDGYTSSCNDCAYLASSSYRANRGGSSFDFASYLLASNRDVGLPPTVRDYLRGARCARTP